MANKRGSVKKYFLFAHDPGGGLAIAKVAEYLTENSSCRMEIYAAGPCLDLYRRLGLKVIQLENDIGQTLANSSPDAVLTATSLSAPHDRALIREAALLSIPVMTIIDHWSNYRL